MKTKPLLPVFALLCGAGGFALRLLQNQTGFEPGTGLSVPGNLYARLLLIFLAAAVALLWLLSRGLKDGDSLPAFPEHFLSDGKAELTLMICGIFLMGVSGALDVLSGLAGGGALDSVLSAGGMVGFAVVSSGATPFSLVLSGALTLVTAAALFPVAAACRRREEPARVDPALILAPAVIFVFRLVLVYRTVSVNPTIAAYYVELLTIVFLTLAFYRFSSFSFRAGRTDCFAFLSSVAVLLSITHLADGFSSAALAYLGAAAVLFGLLLLRLRQKPCSVN